MASEQVDIKELLKEIQCPELEKLQKLFTGLDFTEDLEEAPELAKHLKLKIQEKAMDAQDPLLAPDAPKLDEDFSNYFIINNLPVIKKEEEAKVNKLKGLMTKVLKDNNMEIDNDDIDISFNEETGTTYGTAFLKMRSEEEARLGATIFQGHKLGKSITFTTCMFSEFEPMMSESSDQKQQTVATELKDLRAPVFDTKREQYFYRAGKRVQVNYFDKQKAIHRQVDESLVTLENVAGQAMWSPQGTYLIIVRTDQVDFLGGESMTPIISIPQSQVKSVNMSPCENYVLTYSPNGDKLKLKVWNFKMVEVISQGVLEDGEDENTFQWSHNGKHIAKKFRTELKKDDAEVKVKVGISVFSMPQMKLLERSDGQKKSITIPGINEWMWVPGKNLIAFSCFHGTEKLNEEDENYEEKKSALQAPSIGFLSIPDRQFVQSVNMNDSLSLTMRMHEKGRYLGVINEQRGKKNTGQNKYTIELFDITNKNIPYQKIVYNKPVIQFTDIYWDVKNNMLALHSLDKKEANQYTHDAKRHGVEFYQMTQDTLKGFQVKHIGVHPSEKVVHFSWSPAGDIFAIQESDMGYKTAWVFYLIVEGEAEKPQDEYIAPIIRGKGGKQAAMKNKNMLAAEEIKYEFRKTARQETVDQVTRPIWDESGRLFILQGEKRPQDFMFDKVPRHIKFYNIFGEPIQSIDKITELANFNWRPRPSNILDKKTKTTLQKDFRKMYAKEYKEEEKKERAIILEDLRLKKKGIRDDFLNNFYLPMRRKYEADIDQYKAMWPLKDQNALEPEPYPVNHVYCYEKLVQTKDYVPPK